MADFDDGSEMFGGVGRSGFGDLAALDQDLDGKITAADLLWSSLAMWQDQDRDGVTDAGELRSLDDLGIVSIDLGAVALDLDTVQGAHLAAVADVAFADGSERHAHDAVLATNRTDTRYAGEAGRAVWQGAGTLDLEGFGRITDLSVAAASRHRSRRRTLPGRHARKNPLAFIDNHLAVARALTFIGRGGGSRSRERGMLGRKVHGRGGYVP